jgi:hypothetical protein
MTIIAGFRCHDGIVICADTQETLDFSKRNVSKVVVKPWSLNSPSLSGTSVAMAICGAGDGALIDHLSSKVWDNARPSQSLDEACEISETTIKNTYQEYWDIFPPGQCPSVQLIYGIKNEEDSRLFVAQGPIVNKVEMGHACTGGIGCYMADYLIARMNTEYSDVYRSVLLAAYILKQAKEHVVGCGGDSHIVVLRHNGYSGLIDQHRVGALTNLLESTDHVLGNLLLSAADLRAETKLEKELDLLRHCFSEFRKSMHDELANHEWLNSFLTSENDTVDDLGFRVPKASPPSRDDDPLA